MTTPRHLSRTKIEKVQTRIDLREDPSREAETSDSPSASLLSIQNIMAREGLKQ